MATFCVQLFGDLLSAILGGDLFAPVGALFLLAVGFSSLIALRR